MAVTIAALKQIMARKGNKIINDQVNLASPLVEKMPKEKCSGFVKSINVQAGAVATQRIAGGGTYNESASGSSIGANTSDVTQILATPVDRSARMQIPLPAAEEVTGKADSFNLVKNQLSVAASSLGQHLGADVIDDGAATITASGTDPNGSAFSLTVDNIARFRVGGVYELYDDSASAVAVNDLKVTSITDNGDGTGVIAGTTSDTLTVQDGYDTLNSLGATAVSGSVSLSDLCGSSTVYGTAVSGADWSGTDSALSGALSATALRQLFSDIRRRSGKYPDHVVISVAQFEEYQDLFAGAAGGRRFMEASFDPYGKDHMAPTFMGAKIVVDDNCPDGKVYAFHSAHTKLGVWRDFGPRMGEAGGAEVSQTAHELLLTLVGRHQLLCDKRNSVGRRTGVTLT